MSGRSRSLLFVLGYLAVYVAALAALTTVEKFSFEEPLFLLAVFAVFSVVAWLLTRNATPLPADAPGTAGVLLYLIPLAAFVTWGFPQEEILLTLAKLLAFVALPALLFRTRLALSWSRRTTITFAVLAAALTGLQILFGSGVKRIAALHLPPPLLGFAVIASFSWLSIEAGLVEEYFFRATLQTRLERAAQSAAGGIVIAALLFGLTHAPGLYLRTALTHEALGSHPSLLQAVCYSIVMLSPPGIFFGVLWSRTRNLLLLLLLHGAADLLPNLPEVVRTFRIG